MNAASLFSGVGGLDLGFLRRGFQLDLACDLSDAARSTYESNLRHTPRNSCVREINNRELAGKDLILAGPPCQGFSNVGKRNPTDKRNFLTRDTAHIIAAAQPRTFIIENVRGIKWSAGGAFVSETLSILRESGLSAEILDIDCAVLGVAQRRRRVLIVGGRPRTGNAAIRAVQECVARAQKTRMVRDALLPVPKIGTLPNHVSRKHRTKWYDDVIAVIEPGQKLCDTRLGPSSVHSWEIPNVFGPVTTQEETLLLTLARLRRKERGRSYSHIGDGRPVTLGQLASELGLTIDQIDTMSAKLESMDYVVRKPGYVDLRRKFNGRFKRLALDAPAPAVLKDFGCARNVLHPTKPRGLTVRECARLQGFEDDFVFEGSLTDQFQCVANAFPPPVSALLADCIAPVLS